MENEIDKSYLIMNLPEHDDEWECHLFGMEHHILIPLKGEVPNWFWRKMQYLCFGNKWVHKENNNEKPE